MQLAYLQYAAVFKALSDETRLKIIDMLSCGELCACEILSSLSISQSTLSYHMKILVDCGLVKAARDGAWMRYTLNLAKTGDVIAFIAAITHEKADCLCNQCGDTVKEENSMTDTRPGDCSCGSGCCPPQATKKVAIEFLYLDLNVCERCQGTESNLEAALREVAAVLNAAGYEVVVDKINVTSAELAVQHRFLSSPTIRVNGQDLALDVTETICQDCGSLCGEETLCRSWLHEGVEYDEPPKALLIEGILKAVFGGGQPALAGPEPYVLPANLAKFFAGLADKKSET